MIKLFVVEDEAIVALEIQDLLRGLGYDVCGHAANARTALREILALRPDAVLMDINLGPGMNGIEVAEQLRAVIDVPVVFVTAYVDPMLTERAVTTGGFAYVVKPFLPEVLHASIEMAVSHQRAQRRLRDAHRALHASQQLYEGLALTAPVGVFRTDVDGTCVFANPTYCLIAGVTPERALGLGWLDTIHPEDRHAVFTQWRLATRERRPFCMEFRFLAAGGPEVHVLGQSAPLRDPHGDVVGSIGTITDITTRKTAEGALRESEERYRRLFEDAIEGIVQTRIDGTIEAANPAFARMLGHDSAAELIGANVLQCYAAPEDRRRLLADTEGTDTFVVADTRWVKRNGERITVEIVGRGIRDARGTITHFRSMVRDVTEQAQLRAVMEVLSTGLALLSGAAFYNEVAVQLAEIVGAEVGFVGILKPGSPARIRTVGLGVDGNEAPATEYELTGTACEHMLARRAVVVPEGVRRTFPGDPFLHQYDAEAYIASPLVDSTGALVGHIGVIARRPIRHPARVESVTNIFAQRVSSELERAGSSAANWRRGDAPPDPAPGPGQAEAHVSGANPAELTISALSLSFSVSHDEEYIELRALHPGGTIDLKARAHHYLLLLLARIRLASRALPPDEQGWVHQEVLLRQMRIDTSRLYLDIYRVRRQLAEAGIRDASNIVERRPGPAASGWVSHVSRFTRSRARPPETGRPEGGMSSHKRSPEHHRDHTGPRHRYILHRTCLSSHWIFLETDAETRRPGALGGALQLLRPGALGEAEAEHERASEDLDHAGRQEECPGLVGIRGRGRRLPDDTAFAMPATMLDGDSRAGSGGHPGVVPRPEHPSRDQLRRADEQGDATSDDQAGARTVYLLDRPQRLRLPRPPSRLDVLHPGVRMAQGHPRRGRCRDVRGHGGRDRGIDRPHRGARSRLR